MEKTTPNKKGENKMKTKLKTLKDIGLKNSSSEDGLWRCMGCCNPEFNELKAEAIKWVKKFGVKNMWEFMIFFNLTEEDLK